MSGGHLDSFISAPAKSQAPVAVSPEIRDRGSLFVGALYRATTAREAHSNVAHVKHIANRNKKATHDISAWRCMVLKPGRNGLGGTDDFELVQGSKDDGESWAGGKVLKVMQQWAVLDAVVVVSRWYGGTLLGPARFTHIETCATEVCKAFKRTEELQDYITTLRMLDDTLASVRHKLATLNAGPDSNIAAGKRDELVTQPTSADPAPGIPNATGNSSLEANTETSSPSGLQHSSSPDVEGQPNEEPELAMKSALSQSSTQSHPPPKTPSYSDLDISKAKRLIQARENAIKAVRVLIAKKEQEKVACS